ncbi:MAG: tight adherence protein C [Paraglaciecola sp.]|jgi:tight adherence protein C
MDEMKAVIANAISDPQIVKWSIYLIASLAGITFSVALSYLYSGLYSPIKAQIYKLSNKGPETKDLAKDYSTSLEHTMKSLKNIPILNKEYNGDQSTKKLLIHAGFNSQDALKIFNAIKLLLLLISAIGVSIALTQISSISTIVSIYLVILIMGIAYLLPGMTLKKMAKNRMDDLRKCFPDALDILIVCCESGLGLLESFQRVATEFQYSHPDLSYELNLVCSKVRYGLSLQQALKEFSDRTGLEDIRGLNAVIVQSLRLGTGIASTIRVYAVEYRDKRLQAAEEKAAKIGVKMVFPMMCCIWPSFFIVAIGPAVLNVMKVWDKAF